MGLATGVGIGIQFSRGGGQSWESYWAEKSLFWSDGTTADAGATLVDNSGNGNNAVLTDNLISNPGLEDDYASLYDNNPAVPAVTNERSNAIAPHSGTYSRHILLHGSNTGVRVLPYATKTGETITYSFWTYSVGGSGTIRFVIYKGDLSGTIVGATAATVQVGVWRQTTGSYVETGGGPGAYIAIYCTTATSREFYLDDFSFTTDSGKVACIMPSSAEMAAIDTSAIFYHASGYPMTVRYKVKEDPVGYNRSVFVYPGGNIYFASATLSYKDYCNLVTYLDYGTLFYANIENEVDVIAAGGGDYTTIALAVAGIADANYLNRYKINLHDDITITALADFSVVDGSYHRYFNLADYCYLDGGGKTITASIPPTAADAETQYYEPCATHYICGMKDINISMKNGRYAMHVDATTATNKKQEYFNCNFTNYSTQEVIDYRIANAQAYNSVNSGNIACGMGCYSGQRIYYKDCTMSGIHGVSMHTNVNFSISARLILFDCTLISLPIVQTNYNPTGAILSGLNTIGYMSRITNYVDVYKGTINGGIKWDAWYSEGTATNLYILDDITVSKFSNSASFTNIATAGGALKITSATAGAVDTVAGTGATALTSDTCDYDSNYALGRLEIGEEWEAYNAGINMGTRLGNCSVANKTMTLNVDGVAKTITFNEDFSAKDNAYCLAFINTALAGSAIASLYQRASENALVTLT
jgi:hypothetical protein